MSCELTEKVSLLVDGELSPPETRSVERHLLTCDACQQARTDFLNLRQQISAYTPALNAHAQQRALASVLGKQGRAATRAARPTATTVAQRRPARIFGVPALPFAVAALTTAVVTLIVSAFAIHIIQQRSSAPQIASTQANDSRGNSAPEQPIDTTNENDKVNTAGGGSEITKGKEPADQNPPQLEHQPATDEAGHRQPPAVNYERVRSRRPVSSGNTLARNANINAPSDLNVPELLPQPTASAPNYITINASAPVA